MENTLCYGDNLDILRRYIPDNSIDLIYLDPPFKSDQSYNILFKEKNGTESAAQIKVFEDTWHWDRKAAETYEEVTEKASQRVADLVVALRKFLGTNDMMAYLVMMTIRLVELHRVLKDTGSIYLHCDPTASHYLKLVMDAVFGVKGFRNEVVWLYTRPGTKHQKQFPRVHDIILWYSKSDNWIFNPDAVRIPYSKKTIERGKYSVATSKVTKGIHERVLPYGGKCPEDWWHIPMIQGNARERLGYPTQKPEVLLERIIKASSNEGDIVLDPFCGCGTTITVAEKLKRKWIGIDITHLAISLMRHRINDTFGDNVKYEVIGEPVDLKGSEELAKQDPYQFEWWALGLVGARPAESEKKKGKDRGIDGYIYFHDEPQKTKKIVIQVKSGHVNPGQIRDLRGVIEREDAQIGVFITLNKPTKGMIKEAVSAGYYKSPGWGKDYLRLQILTVEELLEGKAIEYPPKTSITFKKAERVKVDDHVQFTIEEKKTK